MSRVVGFSLKLEGSNKTIEDIGKVEKALKGITDQINSNKKINVGILKPLFEGQDQFRTALKATNKALKEQSDLLAGLGNSKNVDKTVLDALIKQVNNLKLEINKLQQELNNLKSPSVSVPNPEGFEKIVHKTDDVINRVKDIAPAIEQLTQGASASLLNKLAEIDLRLVKVKENIKTVKASDDPSRTESLAALIAEEKALKAESAALNKELNEQARSHTAVSKAIDTTSVIGMRQELAKLKKEYLNLSEAEREGAKGQELFNKSVALNSKVSNIEQSLGDFRRNVGNYRDAVTGLIPQLEKLQQAGILSQSSLINTFKADNKAKVAELTAEVNKLATALDRMTKEEREAAHGVAAFAQLETKVKELNATVLTTATGFDKFKSGALGIGNAITGGLIGGGFVVAFQTAFQGIKKAIDISSELSDVESDVRKTTGLTIQQVQQLENAFKGLDTRTSTTDLLKISAVAGQLGVTGVHGIEDFTKALNVVSVALGDDLQGGVDEISRDLSRLSNVLFGATTDGTELSQNILHIGNSLNVLASTSAATGDNIVDFAQRIGRSLVPLGVSAEEVLALSATFDELSIRPEQGATAINNLIKDIGANTKDIAKTLSLNEGELRRAFNVDPLKAFNIVLDKITTLSGGDKTKLLAYLKDIKQTGQGVSDVFLALGKNTDIYGRNLENSTDSLKKTSSLFNEFNLKNENLAGTFDKLSKKIQDIASNPGFIEFISLAGTALSNLVGIIGVVVNGIGEFSLTIKNIFSGISSGFGLFESAELAASEAGKIYLKGQSDINSMLKKEQESIYINIGLLKSDTASREQKEKAISDLVQKYPELLNKYQLESASLQELEKLQKDLTATAKQEAFKRFSNEIKLNNETLILRKKFRIEEIKAGADLTTGEKTGGWLANIKKDDGSFDFAKGAIKNLETEIKNLEFVSEKANNALNNIGVIDKTQSRSTEELFNNLGGEIKAFINDLNIESADLKLDDNLKDQIEKIRKRAKELETFSFRVGKDGEISSTESQALDSLTNDLNGLINQYNKAKDAKKDFGGNNDDTNSLDKTSEAAKKAAEELEALRRQIRALQIEAIDNDFDKQVAKVVEDSANKIADLRKSIDDKSSKEKVLLTNKLISETERAAKAEKDRINSARDKAIESARNELIKLKKEIDGIVNNTVEINIQTNISNAQFDLAQENRTIEITYDGKIEPLKKALAEGKLSQKQFDKDVYELDKDRLDKQLIAATNFKKITDDLYDALYKTQLRQLEIDNDRIKSGIILKGQQEQQLAFENRKTGKSNVNPINEAITIASKTNAELLDQETKFNDSKNKLDKDHTKNVQATEDQINEIRKKGAEKTTENTKSTNEEIKLAREELEKAILDLAINSAKEISDAIFEIEKTQQDRILQQQLSALEKSRDARLKMVKGNTAEEERINAEFNDKKNKLERAAFEKGKQLSIQQAIISGSLAVLNALATVKPLVPLGLIAAAGIAVTTAVQVAKIRSTSFAEGGLIKKLNSRGEGGRTGGSNAPPDHTGERPVGTATFHEGEYITPRWQVESNKELIEAMDKDRLLKTNHHSKKYLQKQILQAIEAREKSNTGLFRKREPIQVPVFYQASYFKKEQQQSLSISDEAIDRLADKIALRAEQAIERGVSTGYSKSVKEITKDEVRKIKHELLKAQ